MKNFLERHEELLIIVIIVFLLSLCPIQGQEWNVFHTFSYEKMGNNWVNKVNNVGWWKTASNEQRYEYVYVFTQGMYSMAYYVWMFEDELGIDTEKHSLYAIVDIGIIVNRISTTIWVLNIPDWLGLTYVVSILWDSPMLSDFGYSRWDTKLDWWKKNPKVFFKVVK